MCKFIPRGIVKDFLCFILRVCDIISDWKFGDPFVLSLWVIVKTREKGACKVQNYLLLEKWHRFGDHNL